MYSVCLFIGMLLLPSEKVLAMQEVVQVSGYVKDIHGEPIPGATVNILSTSIAAVTDANGKYTLRDIEKGSYQVEVRSVGYRPVRQRIDVDKKLQFDILLEESTMGLEQVVVTGTMQPVFITQSPVKVEVITAEHLNTYTPAAASGIIEGIKLINGVREVVACGVCFTNSISINGLPGAYTAVLMDGTPIYGNLASVYGLNGIPNMIIDRLEVIKGPGSTLYGSEAVAGVINIITKDPEDQPFLDIDLMGTSHLESFGNIAIAPVVAKSAGFIGLNYAYINDFDDGNGDGFGDLINMDRLSFFTKWNIHRNSGKKFTIAGKYYYEDRRNGVEEFLRNRNYRHLRGSDRVYGESIYTNRVEFFGTYEFPVDFNLRLDYSLSTHDQDSYYGLDFYKAKQDIVFGNLVWHNRFKDHQITTGLTSRYQFYDDNTVATEELAAGVINNAPDRQFIPGIFIQDEWEISKKITLLTGIRFDNYEKHGIIFSPRLNIKYAPGQWTTFRINSGTGFRVVNLFAEDHAFITGQRQVEILEDLKPERSYNLALNFNHIYILGSSQGMLDVDAYYTYFTNKIIPNYEQQGKIIYANTKGFAITRGIGVNINQELLIPLSFNLGITLLKATETDEDGEKRPIEFAPEWSGVFNTNYQWKEQDLVFAYSFQITGPMQLPEVYDLDKNGDFMNDHRPIRSTSFALHNFQITKKIKNSLSIYGGVQNIFNFIQEYSPLTGYNDPSALPGFSNYFDTAYAFAPIHGREFYLGFKWQFTSK